MSRPLYVMVSIPEAKVENVFETPIILGVFDSKETAQNAWKARSSEFKDIKAKTIHKYYETYDEYLQKKTWLEEQKPIGARSFYEKQGWVFYASNEDIIEKIEINRLVRIPVQLAEEKQ